jgi:hypothetical protein
MPTGYVISEKSFEYNDEIYYTGEDDGGTPQKVFLDRFKAEQELATLERAKWRGEEPRRYAYSLRDICAIDDEDEVGRELARIFGGGKKGKSKRQKRKEELQNILSRTSGLRGTALDKAVLAALNEEFKDTEEKEEPKIDWNDFTVPSHATDKQIDEVRKLFSSLSFYDITEVPVEE